MKVVRRSIYSGEVRVKELPVTQEQVDDYERGVDINICLHNLSDADKIFFVSGVIDEDFDESPITKDDRREK